MDINSVKSLFTMISGEEDYEIYLPIIILSMSETERMLKAGADISDIRLDFLSAAIANFRYVQLKASRDRTQAVMLGNAITSENESGTLRYAEKLMYSYMGMCSELINCDGFVFSGFGKE
jgi:hypothetical protein